MDALVKQFMSTTVAAYIEAHGAPVRHLRETSAVTLFGLIDLMRARPEVPDGVLVDIVWRAFAPEESPWRVRRPTPRPLRPGLGAGWQPRTSGPVGTDSRAET